MEKIVYVTAGFEATEAEQAEIDKLNALVGPHYELTIVNGNKLVETEARAADYVAGDFANAPPYDDGYDEIDPDDLPDHPAISANQVIIRDGDTLTLESAAGTVSVSVTDNVATYTLD